jgi:DNA helicase-2/ATP-dependent DNA helicase PcrA
MVVGDDAQSIYSWRGADFRNILEFPKRHTGAVVYKIETNYRSVPEVLSVANAAIASNVHQFRKELHASREGGGLKPALVPLPDTQQQAQFVAQRMLELNEEGIPLEEMAVLYRAHYHSMDLQMELTRRGIPFELTSGLRFFEQAHIKDVGAFMKWVVNPRDEVAFKRMAKLLPGVGARSADSLWLGVEQALACSTAPLLAPPTPATSASVSPAESAPVDATPSALAPADAPTQPLPETIANPWAGLPPVKEILLPLKVPAKAQKAWQQLAFTLDELVPKGHLAPPAQMIESIMEAIYDDYLLANFRITSSAVRTSTPSRTSPSNTNRRRHFLIN